MWNRSCQRPLPNKREWARSAPALRSASTQASALWVGVADALTQVIGALLISLVRLYQLTLSPLLGPSCRFHPTCSAYAMEAIRQYGPLRGTRRALRRLARCHPWSEGGFDPVR
jgi:hypothetical protein